MMNANEVASITILVPFKRPGVSITHEIVNFKVFKKQEQYKAVPLLETTERSFTDLPAEIYFILSDGEIISGRGDNYTGLLETIVRELRIKQHHY